MSAERRYENKASPNDRISRKFGFIFTDEQKANFSGRRSVAVRIFISIGID